MSTNRLVHEKSPYLRQHAHNPVDWYPWGEEAFAKARAEDKPIFLSIGYSTCHWCHVMERESFENEQTAELMNRWFVSIKVDREERPDIDRIYMSYVQASTGSGGWPMSVWLTPELRPFVGGTYFPPDNRWGRAGFPLVLERVSEAWKQDRERIIESSNEVMRQLAPRESAGAPDRIDTSVMERCFQQFRRMFDAERGGFGGAPKFPRPSIHNFLLRYWKRTGNEEALDMVAATLIAMAAGGMNDQLGGGFHRYSVDEYWFVPHFEKMLYDQAQLVVSLVEAFQITRNEALEVAARRTLDYVLRDMTSPEGAFWSAEDADSAADPEKPNEKGEGAFYIWTMSEVEELLGKERAGWFAWRYGMERPGNVQQDPHHEFTGHNILFQAHGIEETAQHFDRDAAEIAQALGESERILFEARAKRPRPHLDDKILTSWNGLMISAFAKAGRALDDERYLTAAKMAADFLLTTMRQPDGSLLRRYHSGEAAIGGMLDDYAFFAQALIDLYEATFEYRYLDAASGITEKQRHLLEDTAGGGFFASAHADASGLLRLKDDHDGAEPSGNSIAMMNLLRLARITGREEYEESARGVVRAFAHVLEQAPQAMPQMLCACEFALQPAREIVVAGYPDAEMMRQIRETFDPWRTLLCASDEMAAFHPAMRDMKGPAVYVCRNFACEAPVSSAADLAPLLK
jgi:uncharacterized protein YyaL (SSP411 family)